MSNLPKEVREAMALEIGLAILAERHNDSVANFRAALDANDFLYSKMQVVSIGRSVADAALSALGEAGYAVVPVKPSGAMMEAAFDAFEVSDPKQYPNGHEARRAIWTAMLSASQEQPDV